MAYNVQIKGQDKVLAHLNKLANPSKTFDNAIHETAVRSHAELVTATLSKKKLNTNFQSRGQNVTSQLLQTGDTSRAWSNPFKVSNGYAITNDKKTADGKYLIAELLEKGHKEIIPKNKFLYIPLSRSGQRKARGAKTEGLVYGKDFVMVKKVKKQAGRNYMKGIIEKSSRYLTREIIKDIRKVFAV